MGRAIPLVLYFLMAPVMTSAETALEPYTYRENFETRELRAWAAHPHWEDTSYNENFRVNTIVPGDPNWSIEHKITPYTPVDNYVGAQKLLDMYLVPDSSLRFRYYLKVNQPVEHLKVYLAAGPEGKLEVTIKNPETNRWAWADIHFPDLPVRIHKLPAKAG